MFAAELFATRRLPQRAGLNALGRLAGAGTLVLVACMLLDYHQLGTLSRWVVPASNNFLQAGFFIALCTLLKMERGAVRWVFSNYLIQMSGQMCYSLYVWHGIAIAPLIQGVFETQEILYYLFWIYLLSALTYRYIEFGHVRDTRALFRVGA